MYSDFVLSDFKNTCGCSSCINFYQERINLLMELIAKETNNSRKEMLEDILFYEDHGSLNYVTNVACDMKLHTASGRLAKTNSFMEMLSL